MKVLGAIQPSYLAWIPYFHRMILSDVFIYLDDVEYSKNSFHNRNRVKGSSGAILLTVSVNYSGNSGRFICEMPISKQQDSLKKHLKTIELCYKKAPFFNEIMLGLVPIYEARWEFIGDLNVALLEYFRLYMGIATPCYRSSKLGVGHLAGNEKLVELCKRFNADSFIVKPNTEDYHPKKIFIEHNIGFRYFDFQDIPYCQLFGEYLPGLSILDLVMNSGRTSLNEVRKKA